MTEECVHALTNHKHQNVQNYSTSNLCVTSASDGMAGRSLVELGENAGVGIARGAVLGRDDALLWRCTTSARHRAKIEFDVRQSVFPPCNALQ